MLQNLDVAPDARGNFISLSNSFSELKYSNSVWKNLMLL